MNRFSKTDSNSLHPLHVILARLPAIAGACAALGALGFSIGWIYTIGYLLPFGAIWLIHQFPYTHFLFASWFPVVMLALFSIFEAKSASEEWRDAEKKDPQGVDLFNIIHINIFLYVIIRLVLFLVDLLWRPIPRHIPWLIDLSETSLAVWLLFSAVRLRTLRWDYTTGLIIALVAIMAFGVLPFHTGYLYGSSAASFHKSTLPTVYLRNTSVTSKLLLHTSDRFYLVHLSSATASHPAMFVKDSDEIDRIQ